MTSSPVAAASETNKSGLTQLGGDTILRSPMTVEELIKLLESQPKHMHVAWVDGKTGNTGYFYTAEQKDIGSEVIDGGPVHLELGACE